MDVMANIPHSCHIVSINIYCSWYDGSSPGHVTRQLGVQAGSDLCLVSVIQAPKV